MFELLDRLFKTETSVAVELSPRAERPVPVRIKNNNERHSWNYTGFIEPGAWGRTQIRCDRCGEERLVWGTGLDAPGIRWGCYRRGATDRFKRGDLVVVTNTSYSRLDYFEQYMGDGTAITRNAGGGTYREPVADLKPA
jgi:hypothetical protein